jgi:hypothetical protein
MDQPLIILYLARKGLAAVVIDEHLVATLGAERLNHRLGRLGMIGRIAEIEVDVKDRGFEIGHVVAALVVDFYGRMIKK